MHARLLRPLTLVAITFSTGAHAQICGGSVTGNTCNVGGWATTFFNYSSPTGGAIYVVSSATNQPAIMTYSGGSNALTGYASASGVSGLYGEHNGSSTLGHGVAGRANHQFGVGVYGEAFSWTNPNTYAKGVYGNSDGYGVYGYSSATGTKGYAWSSNSRGVDGQCNGTDCSGVYGSCSSTGCKAATFVGNVDVYGDFDVSGWKAFKIDHPQDPENKFLRHVAIESSELKTFYDGTTQLDASGRATVKLPSWFEALNRDVRYGLTPIGAPAQLYISREVSNGSFEIAGGAPGLKVSWSVTGVRNDAAAVLRPLVVEGDKPAGKRGRYFAPAAFGHPNDEAYSYYDAPTQNPDGGF